MTADRPLGRPQEYGRSPPKCRCKICGSQTHRWTTKPGDDCPFCEASDAMEEVRPATPMAMLPLNCPDEVLAGFKGVYEPEVIATIYAKIIRLAEVKS